MEMALALIVVGVLSYFPARRTSKAAQQTAEAALKQTATSNGLSTGAMVESMYHRQLKIETKLDQHISSPNPHRWDPDIVAALD